MNNVKDKNRVVRFHMESHHGMPPQMPVQPGPNGYGIIYYEVDGEEWELYPVMPEWCEERNQTSLFTQDGGTEK